MADPKKKADVSEAVVNAGAALLDELIKNGATELRLDRTIYSADKCGGVALVGHIIALLDMPPIEMTKGEAPRAWQAFHFVCTHPTKGVDREDNVVDVPVGDEIIIPATFQLFQNLRRFAYDRHIMHEVGLVPKTKVPLGGGKNLWTYRIITTGNTRERGALYSFEAAYNLPLVGAPPKATTAALPGHNGLYNVQTGEVVNQAVGTS